MKVSELLPAVANPPARAGSARMASPPDSPADGRETINLTHYGWVFDASGYGNALWDNKLELRMPLAKDVLWLVGFLDGAALWQQPTSSLGVGTSMDLMTLDQFYFSTGFGVRFSIPQFPIRLYLAKGFQFKNGSFVWKPLAPGDLAIGDFNFSFVISLGGNVF